LPRIKVSFKFYGEGQNHEIPSLATTTAVLAIYSVQPGVERKTWKIRKKKSYMSSVCHWLLRNSMK